MAVRQITTEISIKNEAEFRKQMKAVNNSLSGMKSEMAKAWPKGLLERINAVQ